MKKSRSPALSKYGKLAEYNRKRRFDVTPEPAGKMGRARKEALEFVIQKHRASRLHYDFRLEHDGVMLSWAVPKGPSLDPSNKRFAMQTEDHPIEYNQFEGVIPEGQYGGGTVMIWDRGSWEPEVEDVEQALAKGDLKFKLHGKKL
ncbi:MAG TPA: DNA polymerase ligase N-terminal domain-containing protein, partial [Candidatus Acidoferrales bacterium]|nr:DNA polymerase ligase N-terminal domain-containing protein [Candidatus Acidoferrales bacterium]